MEADDYNLKWNNFETGITRGFVEIFKKEELFDVTLVCGDHHLKAHRLVLSACSPVFRGILTQANQNPIVYLRGISFMNLEATVKFMYYGEVCISQDKLSEFLSTAEELKVKGLSQSESDKENKAKKRSLPPPLKEFLPKKQKKVVPSPPSSQPVIPLKVEPVIAENDVITENDVVAVHDDEIIADPEDTAVAAMDDYVEYNDYEYCDDYEILPDSDAGMFITDGKGMNSSSRMTGPRPKADRQPIVNFINLNKLKVDGGYMCAFCKRVSADNSNMNRHIEVKHSAELEVYLSQTVAVVE